MIDIMDKYPAAALGSILVLGIRKLSVFHAG